MNFSAFYVLCQLSEGLSTADILENFWLQDEYRFKYYYANYDLDLYKFLKHNVDIIYFIKGLCIITIS